jgi:hypothetical protein
VDDHVDAAELGDGSVDDAPHLVLFEDVGGQGERGGRPVVVALAPGLRQPFLAAGRKHDAAALGREGPGAGPPDAARRAEDDDDALAAIRLAHS